MRRVAGLALVLVVVSGIAGACSGSDGDMGGGGDGDAAAVSDPEAPKGMAGGGISYSADGVVIESSADALGSAGNGGGSAVDLPAIGVSIIKTAQLRLEVGRDELEEAARDAMSIAERFGGFVSTTALNKTERGGGSIELRIPAANFGQALESLHELGKVKSESVSGQDVTQEFVDLQARLRNYQAQEVVLLLLMDRSTSVADTLRVQGQLQQVQLEIERLRGRIRYLEDQTDMSTIRVELVETGAAPAKANAIVRAWRQALDAAVGVVAAVIVGAGFILPIALLLGVVAFVAYRMKPKVSQT
jgi:hypothetical protein